MLFEVVFKCLLRNNYLDSLRSLLSDPHSYVLHLNRPNCFNAGLIWLNNTPLILKNFETICILVFLFTQPSFAYFRC